MRINLLTYTFCLGFIALTQGQIENSDVLLTIDETPVSASEFVRVYNKNLNLVKDEDQKNIDEYLKLFIGYKLKLEEAKALGFDQSPKYLREFGNYKKQLAKNYLTDHEVTGDLVQEAYDRLSYDVQVSHVLVKLDAREKDTTAAYAEIQKWRERFLNEGFDSVLEASKADDDVIAEDLGYFSGFKMVYPFETMAYNTGVGNVSPPFRTNFGYHVLKVFDKRPSRGEVTVGHIMIAHRQTDSSIVPETRIKELYKLIGQGRSFESVAKQYSDDKGSARKGGKLAPFKSGKLRSAQFEDLAFSLTEIDAITEPFSTEFGWHIVKLYDKKPMESFEELQYELESRVKRDPRSRLIREAMIAKLKSKYTIDTSGADLDYFASLLNTDYYSNTWQIPGNLEQDRVLVGIDEATYTNEAFAKQLAGAQRKYGSEQSFKTIVEDQFQEFLDDKILEYHESRLEFDNAEYADILEEYRSGLLLFDLMESKIWNAVKQDSLGLQGYFEAHRSDYVWEERIDALVATCSDEADMKQVRKLLKAELTPDSIAAKLNTDSAQKVIFSSGMKPRDHGAFPKDFNLELGLSPVLNYNDAYHVLQVKAILPQTNKSFEEARGRVISDYQDEVERNWIAELKQKYNVVINETVLGRIKSEYYSN